VRLQLEVDADLPELSSDVELVLYRVAQEALTNVARHAGATLAHLRLSVSAAGVALSVSDDGRGGSIDEGTGIRGMRERASLVGARLVIESAESGTELQLTVPLGEPL
jgi:two-component system sensor histidine kinase UhpB